MLGNGFVFIFSDITFVSVYSFSSGMSSFSNIYSAGKFFPSGKFVIVGSCNNVISPDMCAKLVSGSIAGKSARVRLRIFIGGEYPFEVGWLSVSH